MESHRVDLRPDWVTCYPSASLHTFTLWMAIPNIRHRPRTICGIFTPAHTQPFLRRTLRGLWALCLVCLRQCLTVNVSNLRRQKNQRRFEKSARFCPKTDKADVASPYCVARSLNEMLARNRTVRADEKLKGIGTGFNVKACTDNNLGSLSALPRPQIVMDRFHEFKKIETDFPKIIQERRLTEAKNGLVSLPMQLYLIILNSRPLR